MKILCLLLSLFSSTLSYCQFAVIEDKDGYINVRGKETTSSSALDTLQNGHLVFCFETKGNWTNIDYSKNKTESVGFVYKNRYRLISTYKAIPLFSKANNLVRFFKDSITITVTQKAFNKREHKYRCYKDSPSQIELIDGKNYWGKDGGLPTTEYKSIVVRMGQKVVYLPKAAFANLYEPSLYNTQVNFDEDKNILYIQSMNSDGAGSYGVVWKIENGTYEERFIAYGF